MPEVGLAKTVATSLLALAISGCSDNVNEEVANAGASSPATTTTQPETDRPTEEAELQEQPNQSTAEGLVLPEGFPDAFPLPDEYMVVRRSVGTYDTSGLSIEINIAVDGDVEEITEFYDEALRTEFDDVEFLKNIDYTPWHFSGHGFERGTLYVSSNSGLLDRYGHDSSHLPVMLSIVLNEYHLED